MNEDIIKILTGLLGGGAISAIITALMNRGKVKTDTHAVVFSDMKDLEQVAMDRYNEVRQENVELKKEVAQLREEVRTLRTEIGGLARILKEHGWELKKG